MVANEMADRSAMMNRQFVSSKADQGGNCDVLEDQAGTGDLIFAPSSPPLLGVEDTDAGTGVSHLSNERANAPLGDSDVLIRRYMQAAN